MQSVDLPNGTASEQTTNSIEVEKPAKEPAHAKKADVVQRWWHRYFGGGGRSVKIPEQNMHMQAFEIEEVKALFKFVVDRGVDCEAKTIHKLGELIDLYQSEEGLSSEQKAELIVEYSKLAAKTYSANEVNGRTIRDSAKFGNGAVSQAGNWGGVFFILAVVPDFFFVIIPEDWLISAAANSFFVSFSPFFWGGVGASIFLLKRLSGLAAQSKFDASKLQGIPARVFLGASLGYIIVVVLQGAEILSAASFTEGAIAFHMSGSAVGFLVGLGTKAVYGILESIIDSISDKFAKSESK